MTEIKFKQGAERAAPKVRRLVDSVPHSRSADRFLDNRNQ
jgi:hypothetical protein